MRQSTLLIIANMTEVINEPDSYRIGDFKRGNQRVVLEKTMENGHVAVVEAIKEGDALSVVTFFNKSSRVTDAAEAPRAHVRNVTGSLMTTL